MKLATNIMREEYQTYHSIPASYAMWIKKKKTMFASVNTLNIRTIIHQPLVFSCFSKIQFFFLS